MSTCKSFAPIVDEHSRILILGSMPGIKSLEQQEYYAHPQNRFWRLLALLLQEDVPQDYSAKQALLHKHHIALWDTLGYCEREGSLDSSIKNEAPNAVVELAGELPHLQAVVCNGGKAAAAFKKYLPKTSRAGAGLLSAVYKSCQRAPAFGGFGRALAGYFAIFSIREVLQGVKKHRFMIQ